MSIKSTLVCDGCGTFLCGEPGGFPELQTLMDRARKLGWEWSELPCNDECFCRKCLSKERNGKAVER